MAERKRFAGAVEACGGSWWMMPAAFNALKYILGMLSFVILKIRQTNPLTGSLATILSEQSK